MSYPVQLYVYDLSNGLAKSMSLSLTGTYIEGIWHTSVVVFDQEIYFGQGIFMVKPGSTHHGQPLKIVDLGTTDLPAEIFFEYIEELKERYTAQSYHLLDFNCNTFSNEVVGFLNGSEIPSYVQSLPADFLATPFGRMIRPQIDSFFGAGRSQTAPLNAFGTLDPATILNGLTPQGTSPNVSSHSINIPRTKIEVSKPSTLSELQAITNKADMSVVIVELPDAKKMSSTERVIKGLVEAYADSKKVKEHFPTFSVPKVALVTSERSIPKNHIEDQQTIIVQFFSKGVEVNRTNNFNPSVLQGCLEFTIMKTFSDSSISWDSSIANLNKAPKLFDSRPSQENFISTISSISTPFSSLDLNSVFNNIQKDLFEMPAEDASLLAAEIISCISLVEKESSPDTLALVLKGIAFLLRHPRISYSVAQAKNSLSLFSSILNIFNSQSDSSVRENILGLLVNLYSSYSSSQLSSSVLYPLSESTPSPLNQIAQIVMIGLTDDSLKYTALSLAFNVILHLSQSSLLSEESTRIIIENLPKETTQKVIHNFFELEDGEIFAMEFFSTIVQSLSNSSDSKFIVQLMETLVLAQTRLLLTSSRTIIPALAQSLDFEEILYQKSKTDGLDDKSIKFLEQSAKFITESL